MAYQDNQAEIDRAYQTIKDREHRTPHIYEMPNAGSIIHRFGTWQAYVAYQEELPVQHGSNYIDDDQLLSEISSIYYKLGYPPHSRNYARSATALNRYRNWSEFLKAAGIPAHFAKGTRISQEEVIARFDSLQLELGHVPTLSELAKRHYPTASVYIYYGSFSLFKEQCGMQPSPQHYSLAHLQAVYRDFKADLDVVTQDQFAKALHCDNELIDRLSWQYVRSHRYSDLVRLLAQNH